MSTTSKATPATPTATTVAPASAKLSGDLASLQQTAAVVSNLTLRTNKATFEHLAAMYMWWREAREVEGYLEAEYRKVVKKLRPRSKYGVNFGPLFRVVWGYNNGLSDGTANRWTCVLNDLHKQYEREEYYRTDSVVRLKQYIDLKGGVEGIVGDRSVDDDDDGTEEPVAAIEQVPKDVDLMLEQLYGSARDFYVAAVAPATIDLEATVPLTDDAMSLLLVRKVGSGYQLIGASGDETMVKPVAMQTYLQDFSALPQSIRAIVETVSTQSLPQRIQKFYAALVDSAELAPVTAKAFRRLAYLHSSGEFVLSPVGATSGVVTVAKPTLPVLADVACDVFLSPRARRALELKLISEHDFNFYVPSSASVVPKYTYTHADLASHAIRLQHRFSERTYLHLDFWPCRVGDGVPTGQLALSAGSVGSGTWHAALGLAWFRRFALEFIVLWTKGHGRNITREHQRVFKLNFDLTGLTVHFVYRNGMFENEETVDFGGVQAQGKPIAIHVLSKDFAVAMQAVADLGIVTPVDVDVDEGGLAMRFSTTAADYQLLIPACTAEGDRSSKHVKPCALGALAVDAFEYYYDPADEDGPDEG